MYQGLRTARQAFTSPIGIRLRTRPIPKRMRIASASTSTVRVLKTSSVRAATSIMGTPAAAAASGGSLDHTNARIAAMTPRMTQPTCV